MAQKWPAAPKAFDLDGARKEGYTDTEIADELARRKGYDVAGSRNEGYTDLEIIGHLNKPPALSELHASLEMDRVMKGDVGAAPLPSNQPKYGLLQDPSKQPIVPYYERQKPLPGTELTGLPPVEKVAPQVHYDPWGARPEDGYYAKARAGIAIAPDEIPVANGMPLAGDVLMKSGARAITGLGTTLGRGLTELGTPDEQTALPLVTGPHQVTEGEATGKLAGQGMQAVGQGLMKVFKTAESYIPEDSPEMQHMIGPGIEKDWSQLANPYYMARVAGSTTGSIAGFLVPQVALLRAASLATRGAQAAGMMSVAEALSNGGEIYDEAIRSGKTPFEAHDMFIKSLPMNLISAYALNRVGMFNEKVKNQWVHGGLSSLAEGGEELQQGATQNYLMGDPLLKNGRENFISGALGGQIGSLLTYQGGTPPVPIGDLGSQKSFRGPVGDFVDRGGPGGPGGPGAPPPGAPPGAPPGGGGPGGPGGPGAPGVFPPQHTAPPGTDLGLVPPVEGEAPPPGGAPPGGAPAEAPAIDNPSQAEPDADQRYQEASAYAANFPELGVGALVRKYGISKDEARIILDRLVSDGLFAPKQLRGGGTVFVNLARQGQPGVRAGDVNVDEVLGTEGVTPGWETEGEAGVTPPPTPPAPPPAAPQVEETIEPTLLGEEQGPQPKPAPPQQDLAPPQQDQAPPQQAKRPVDQLAEDFDRIYGSTLPKPVQDRAIQLREQGMPVDEAMQTAWNETQQQDELADVDIQPPQGEQQAPPTQQEQQAPPPQKEQQPPPAEAEEEEQLEEPKTPEDDLPPETGEAPEQKIPVPDEKQEARAAFIRKRYAEEPDWYKTIEGEGPRPPWQDVVERFAKQTEYGSLDTTAWDAVKEFRSQQGKGETQGIPEPPALEQEQPPAPAAPQEPEKAGFTDWQGNPISKEDWIKLLRGEPSAEHYDKLSEDIAAAEKDPAYSADTREGQQLRDHVRDLEEARDFHKPAAIARAEKEIEDERAGKEKGAPKPPPERPQDDTKTPPTEEYEDEDVLVLPLPDEEEQQAPAPKTEEEPAKKPEPPRMDWRKHFAEQPPADAIASFWPATQPHFGTWENLVDQYATASDADPAGTGPIGKWALDQAGISEAEVITPEEKPATTEGEKPPTKVEEPDETPITSPEEKKEPDDARGERGGEGTGPAGTPDPDSLEEVSAKDDGQAQAGGTSGGRGHRGGRSNAGRGSSTDQTDAGTGLGTGDATGEGTVRVPPSGGELPGGKRKVDKPQSGRDFRLTDQILANLGGPVERFVANLDAIELLKKLEAEDRLPTPDEQRVLARYVGWGGLSEAAFGWARDQRSIDRQERLRKLLTREEYEAARTSTLNAHYTSLPVARQIWAGLQRLGVKAGMRMLEPSVGTGIFLGTQPESLLPAWRNAVELDSITSGIAKKLYPDSNIQNVGYQKAGFPEKYFHFAVGNIPFGKYGVADPAFSRFPALTKRIHNYFFAKALAQVKPGGIVAFVTSRYTMDEINSSVRSALAEQADLIGAIRLPGGKKGAFATNAGTEVTTDIIFLRKRRSDESPSDVKWVKATGQESTEDYGAETYKINEYFVANPDMMLGKMAATGSMNRPGELMLEGTFSEEELAAAIAKLPEGVMNTSADGGKAFDPIALTEETSKIKPGGFGLNEKGELVLRTPEGIIPAPFKGEAAKRIRGMMGIRDALKAVYRSQLLDKTDDELAAARKELNKLYDAFTKAYGPISSKPNSKVFGTDPEYPTIKAIEDFDSDTGKATKRDVFTKRTIPVYRPPENVENPQDALGVVLAERGFLDWKRLEAVTGKNRSELIEELGDQVFENPSGDWEVSDEYLSGEVVKKLKAAEAAAKTEPGRYGRNVEALRKVQPTPLTKAEINVKPGAHWIGPKDIKHFLDDFIFGLTGYDLRNSTARADYSDTAAVWTVIVPNNLKRLARNADYNEHFSAHELFEMSLNNKKPKVYFKKQEGEEKARINPEATLKAEDAQDRLVESFEHWLWQDDARRKRLLDTYNEEYNGVRLWEPDGSHLKFPGMARSMLRGEDLDTHQKNGVWRIIRAGNTLLAHVVGAGKTFTMIAAGMEMKRMGLVQKPMYVVPNHLVEQWGGDFLALYPNANILVADPETFSTGLRQETAAKIASGNYDAIILSHKSFEALPISDETFQKFVDKETAEINAELERLQEAKGDNEKKGATVKRLETMLQNLEAQLEKRAKMEAKDKAINFESMGVDQLFVDEAHMFKNLGFYTSLGRVAGLPKSNANRSFDMLMKTQYLSERQGNRGVVFATGTPVANSMAEMYTMMRYLAGPYMKAKGLEKFDAWARQFGRIVRSVELSPEGGKFRMNNRFAKFVNVADMVKGFRTYADVKNVEDLNLPRPELEGGKAKTIVNPAHPLLAAFVRHLGVRAEHIRGGHVDPKDDNMLKITFEGRVAALDIKLFAEVALQEAENIQDDVVNKKAHVAWLEQSLTQARSEASGKKIRADLGIAKKELVKLQQLAIDVQPYLDDPGLVHKELGGKKTMVADNVAKIYKETAKEKSTQLIFLDLGTPKEKSKRQQAAEDVADNPDEVEVEETAEGRVADEAAMEAAAYDEIKKKLIANGVKAEEIAFIHDAKNKDQKQALFKKVNEGTIRILIGSTEKMGAGTNVQKRLKALHHVDVPWRPADIEQREGRILRQGNTNASVRIFQYASEGSFDVYMWQTIGSKADMIHTAMSGDLSIREIEDMSTMALSAKETIALSSGDPVVQERLDVETKVNKLRREKRNNQDAHRQWQASLETLRHRVQVNKSGAQQAREAVDKKNEWLAPKIKEAAEKHAAEKQEGEPEAPKPHSFTGIAAEDLTGAALLPLFDKVSKAKGGTVGKLGPFELIVSEHEATGLLGLEVEDGLGDFISPSKWDTNFWSDPKYKKEALERGAVVLSKLTGYWNSLEAKAKSYESAARTTQTELDAFESAKPDPFKKEAELNAAEKRLDEITDELGLMDDAAPAEEESEEVQNLRRVAGGAAPAAGTQESRLEQAGQAASARTRRRLGSGEVHSGNPLEVAAAIRDMAISIAADVYRGTITAKNFTAKIVQRFGAGARRIARRVFVRAQGIAKRGGAPAATASTTATSTASTTTVAPSPGGPKPELDAFREVAARTGARVDKQKTRLENLKEAWDNFRHSFTREYMHLAPGAQMAPVRMELKKVLAAKAVSQHRALQALREQLDDLSPVEYDQMMDWLALDDLQWRVKRQIAEGGKVNDDDLPWEMTKKGLIAARRQARDVVNANPKLVNTLKLRKAMQDTIRKPLISSFRRAGYKDLTKTLMNPVYYRHRVHDHMDDPNRLGAPGSGGGQKFKLPVGRGYLKKSWVNPRTYSLDYMRTEYEVMNQMMYDTARAEFLAFVRDKKNGYNIAEDVQKKAAEANKETIMPAFERMAKHQNKKYPKGPKWTGETMYQHIMKSRPQDPGYRERLTRKMAGNKYMNFKQAYNEFFSDTHEIYQPVEGSHFFLANSVPEEVAAAALADGETTVKKEQIRQILARGQRREELVLPRELVATLQKFGSAPKNPNLEKFIGKPMGAWKQYKLTGLAGALFYNIRNFSGDAWRLLTTLPKAFRHMRRSYRDIRSFLKTGVPPNAEFKGWWERGGYQSNFHTTESESDSIKSLTDLRRKLLEPPPSMPKQVARGAKAILDEIVGSGKIRDWTNIREGLLRYAAHIEFLKQMRAAPGGRPKTFGASLRDEVMALKSLDDRAYKLSNDLMGNYDEVSEAGKIIRKYPIPFYSFLERNLVSHKRIIQNAAADGRTSAAVGYAILGGARTAVGAATAISVGSAAIKMLGLKALLTAFNWGAWDDEEDDVPESVKKDTHIILGRDMYGKIRGFTRLGSADDILEWWGLNGAPYYAREYLNGNISLKKWANESFPEVGGYIIPIPGIKPGFNKLVQGLTPLAKIPGELIGGKAWFPDVYNPRKIRDRYEYIAREFGAVPLYRWAIGKPQAPVSASKVLDMLTYSWDPKQTHYNSFRYDKVPDYRTDQGMGSSGGYSESPAAEALYLIREAMRYGNQKSLIRGLSDYKNAGGTRANLSKMIDRLHPLGALKPKERQEYERTLDRRETRQLQQAILFWEEHFGARKAELDLAARTAKLPPKRKRGK